MIRRYELIYQYRLMILITEGDMKGYYYQRYVKDIYELANIYENEFEIIEKCDYILDLASGEYLSIFDKDKIINRANTLANRDPFGY